MRRSRPASIVRAQAVSTSKAPVKTDSKDDSDHLWTKDDLDDLWLKLHGVENWAGLLPKDNGGKLNERLRDEVIKYGEMAQLTYDSVDLYPWSRYRDQNRFKLEVKGSEGLFGKNLTKESFFQHLKPELGYEPVAYIYASEKTTVIKNLRDKTNGQAIANNVWIGYIAYSKTERDIVVAWRGTQQPAEWVADGEVSLISYKDYIRPDDKNTPDNTAAKPSPAGHKDPTENAAIRASPAEDKGPRQRFTAVKAYWAALAFVGAAGWGALSASAIFLVLYGIFWFFESDCLLGALFNGAFAAVAALPISKFFPDQVAAVLETAAAVPICKFFGWLQGKTTGDFVLVYALLVGGLTMVANLATSADQFWTVDPLIFALGVLLPTGVTAAIAAYESADEGPQVHEGFYELYDPTGDAKKMPAKHSDKFPRQVVHETLEQLLKDHQDVRTITVTGHSLGGALAVLSAYDIVESGCNERTDKKGKKLNPVERIPVACFAFEAPRVGNPEFKDSFEANFANGLAAIRVVNKPDIVTQVPKAFFLQNVYYLLAAITNNDWLVDRINQVEGLGYRMNLPSAFEHVAPEQQLLHDSRDVDYLKKMPGWWPLDNISSIGNYHNLEVNLHLVSGYWGDTFTRDFALCNKSSDIIDERAGIPPGWFATIIQYVAPAVRGDAIIEPYSQDLPPTDGPDNARKIGQGPAVTVDGKTECKPLIRNYFKDYLKEEAPVEQQKFEALDVRPRQ